MNTDKKAVEYRRTPRRYRGGVTLRPIIKTKINRQDAKAA
jgi:hypothetical protein